MFGNVVCEMAAILFRGRWVNQWSTHDGAMTWKRFPHYWPFVRRIHRSSVVFGGFPSQRTSNAEMWWGSLLLPRLNHSRNSRVAKSKVIPSTLLLLQTWRPYAISKCGNFMTQHPRYTRILPHGYMRRFTDKTGDCWVLHLSSCSTTLYICHYNDFIMNAMASRITGVSSVCSTVCSGADQRKHQSSASLTFEGGIHRWPVNSPHKWPVTRKIFPFMTHHGHRTRHSSTGLAYT